MSTFGEVLEDPAARSLRNGLEQWVQMMKFAGHRPPPGFKYGSFHEYVLERGQVMTSTKPTEKQLLQVAADVKAISPEMQQCYYNSQKLALRFPERYRYFEGYAMARLPLPIQHGWVMTKGKNPIIVDSTWKRDQKGKHVIGNIVVGEIPEGWAYMGTPFKNDLLMQRWVGGEAGSLLDWPPKFPAMCQRRKRKAR